jgi:ATP-dependent phosphoenolpyruvate carboxykinase
MEMTMSFASAEAAAEAHVMIKKVSGDSTWDRLAEYLEKQISGKEIFVINRSFGVDLKTIL